MIVYCADAADVSRAVTFARSGGYLVAVCSGGHNVAGLPVCDDGIVIDLARLKRIEIDPVHRIARAGAGLSLGEFDRATQSHGLATTMGVNSDTGIAGLTLGGGFGRLGRKHGLACDNLIAAEIVLADGRMLRASATENADLLCLRERAWRHATAGFEAGWRGDRPGPEDGDTLRKPRCALRLLPHLDLGRSGRR
ncbi:FAD-dependent oxidoreductase [Cupriavidus sp. KK10]|jgi:FAD/FMN-containing dehydrogenase|uniref:FAD-binding oxidoreductase n=1 Tax=Cupriavidus sp. KK10 TaxID=1478019 RepID=UPI002012D42C|nr:FAD-dependent oxidoreductase [Cupriavidus sp. KK10]